MIGTSASLSSSLQCPSSVKDGHLDRVTQALESGCQGHKLPLRPTNPKPRDEKQNTYLLFSICHWPNRSVMLFIQNRVNFPAASGKKVSRLDLGHNAEFAEDI